MVGPLINPTPEPEIREVDEAGVFHRQMLERRARDGEFPEVKVVIQVRGHVIPIGKYRTRLARAIRRLGRRGVPVDERGPLLERAMQETDSREWEDVEVYWSGQYDPEQVEMPTAAKLEQIEEKFGAAEARATVRTLT